MGFDRTRVVRWLRVLLPLVALAILSTLFLLGRGPGVEPVIPYAEVDAQAMAERPRITAPAWAGVTPDGAAVTLGAAEVEPGAGTARDVRLAWDAPEGLHIDLTAPEAARTDGAIRLSGGVNAATSTGWHLSAPAFQAALDRSQLTAPQGVVAQAPFGEVTAGALEVRRAGDDHILNFTGGVRLLYRP